MKKLICKLLALIGIKKCGRCAECPKKACHPECKPIAKAAKAKKAPKKK